VEKPDTRIKSEFGDRESRFGFQNRVQIVENCEVATEGPPMFGTAANESPGNRGAVRATPSNTLGPHVPNGLAPEFLQR